jgi:hypothetical protein
VVLRPQVTLLDGATSPKSILQETLDSVEFNFTSTGSAWM